MARVQTARGATRVDGNVATGGARHLYARSAGVGDQARPCSHGWKRSRGHGGRARDGDRSAVHRMHPDAVGGKWEQCSSKAMMGPNVEGNRRADEMLAEDQAVCRRVRLTVRLGQRLFVGPENRIYSCLVTRTLRFEPFEDVGIKAQRDRSLGWNRLQSPTRDAANDVFHRCLGMLG